MNPMFQAPEFHGSTTVGERGQAVLPAALRKKFGILPGDKLLVMAMEMPDGKTGGIILVKAEVLDNLLSDMGRGIKDFSMKIKQGGQKKRSASK